MIQVQIIWKDESIAWFREVESGVTVFCKIENMNNKVYVLTSYAQILLPLILWKRVSIVE